MSEDIDIRGNVYPETDKELDNKLRPLKFNDFKGQRQIVDNLNVFVKAASMRNEALDHVLLHGPPRAGKNHTFAYYSQRNGGGH